MHLHSVALTTMTKTMDSKDNKDMTAYEARDIEVSK